MKINEKSQGFGGVSLKKCPGFTHSGLVLCCALVSLGVWIYAKVTTKLEHSENA